MTTTPTASMNPPMTRHLATAITLRGVTCALHLLVTTLAVFSLCFNRFDLWLDLRLLGGAGAAIVTIIWAASALLVPWCAGPWLSGFCSRWTNAGKSERWTRRLLWPTYFLLICLAVNTVYYYRLIAIGRMDSPLELPISLLIAVLLGTWVLATRNWLRVADNGPKNEPATWTTRLTSALFAAAAITAASVFFLLQSYQHPPIEPVDLAVVLGNRVMPDGTASAILRDRTLVAVNLYKRGLARHLFLSGAVSPPAKPGGPLLNEPAAMLQVCLAAGVPESAITLDPQGVNTRATAFNAQHYLQARGLKTVVACSDDYHLFRTAMSFHEVGIDPCTQASIRQEWICTDLAGLGRELVAVVVYKLDRSYRAPKETAMKLNSPRVLVKKVPGTLEIYDDAAGSGGAAPGHAGTLVKTYACITGGNPGDKEVEGDKKTPLGNFHVVFKNEKSKYHLSLGLDYPAADDAQRGLAAGLITHVEYDAILAALKSDLSLEENQKKLWYTKLGGEIFIHGHGTGRNWTAGCVALSDPDIEEVFAVLPVGTPVEIRP